MRIDPLSPLRWMPRLVGILLLSGTIFVARGLEAIGYGRAGHEPALAYCLALLAFAGGTIGVALAAFGRHLLDPVPVADRWVSHLAHDQPGARWS
jgi:hypothetical protein